jgi:hypothetical protein
MTGIGRPRNLFRLAQHHLTSGFGEPENFADYSTRTSVAVFGLNQINKGERSWQAFANYFVPHCHV